ncbi:MAG: GNAT family N-acetyltransferase [Clostridia bacterium]
MELRIAEKSDLPQLKIVFNDIVENMHKNGITIWDEFYPYEEFDNDIENRNLYLIVSGEEIAAAFGIFDTADGQTSFEWKDKNAKAVYLGRVGVAVNYLRQGVGSMLLDYASELAKQKNANFTVAGC